MLVGAAILSGIRPNRSTLTMAYLLASNLGVSTAEFLEAARKTGHPLRRPMTGSPCLAVGVHRGDLRKVLASLA